jgi:hypothetical protein
MNSVSIEVSSQQHNVHMEIRFPWKLLKEIIRIVLATSDNHRATIFIAMEKNVVITPPPPPNTSNRAIQLKLFMLPGN